MALIAGQFNFIIEQGSEVNRTITWKDSNGDANDLTGYTAIMTAKKPDGTTIFSLTESAGLTLGGAAGTIVINISGAVTADYNFKRGDYDIVLYPAGAAADAIKLIEGFVIFKKTQV